MLKTCTVSGKQFEITNDDLKFYEKIGVPTPTLCPAERQRRRLAFINVKNLYHKGSIISPFSSDKHLNIVPYEKWISDEIDGKKYGFDFNLQIPFFD